jgi:hypothetical protein
MHESDTYLAILEEGEKIGARKSILILGTKRFGLPEKTVKDRLNTVTDLDHLDRMFHCAIIAASWQEIIDTP